MHACHHSLKAASVVAFALSLFATACGEGEEISGGPPSQTTKSDLTVNGTGFGPHDGEVMSVALLDAAGEYIAAGATIINGGAFSVTFPGSIADGINYRLDYYADHDKNGLCSIPALSGDHGWRQTMTGTSSALNQPVTHNIAFEADVCTSFPAYDLQLNGAFGPHAGQTLYVAVVRTLDDLLVTEQSTVLPQNGILAWAVRGILQRGVDYRVDYYADTNGDGACQGPAFDQDHAWAAVVRSVGGNTSVTGSDPSPFDPLACAAFPGGVPTGPFDLNVTGTGFAPHDGQVMSVALTTIDGTVIARAMGVIAGGRFSAAFPGRLEAGQSYRLDYYADRDLDGVCTPPALAGDHGWRTEIRSVSAAVDTSVVHSITFEPTVCGSFPTRDLAFSGTYSPHAGQTMYAKLVRDIDGTSIATTSQVVPAGGAVLMSLPASVQDGATYHFDYFADTNSDGLCSGPALAQDHGWRVTVPAVSTAVALSRNHDTAFEPTVCASF
ncbi:MAG: hypothetical protein HY903_04010 [Deltaproteobacteria bacterium]|nr:hypothetical protein [Deltaproteobacteria bacterium]